MNILEDHVMWSCPDVDCTKKTELQCGSYHQPGFTYQATSYQYSSLHFHLWTEHVFWRHNSQEEWESPQLSWNANSVSSSTIKEDINDLSRNPAKCCHQRPSSCNDNTHVVDLTVHRYDPSTEPTGAGRSRVQGQPELKSKTYLQNTKAKNSNKIQT